MKLVLLSIKGSKEPWAENAIESYHKKINHLWPMDIVSLKSKSHGRDDQHAKVNHEDKAFTGYFEANDLVILFDEKGKGFNDSTDFSKFLVSSIESSKQRIIFVIGGPYGFGEQTKARADKTIQLSNLTMNHHVAQVTALEQIYRGLTIWKGLPYHNV